MTARARTSTLLVATTLLLSGAPGCVTWITWEALPRRLDASRQPSTLGVDRVQAWRFWRSWIVEVCEDGQARYEVWRPSPDPSRDELEGIGRCARVPEGAVRVPVEVVDHALDGRPSRFAVQDVESGGPIPGGQTSRRLTFDLERTEPVPHPLPRAVAKVLLRLALPLALALDVATFPFQLVALTLADGSGLP